MIDVNYPLRKAYYEKLSTITYLGVPVPVYYKYIPDNVEPGNYIVFTPVVSVDRSTTNSNDTSTSMRVTVHTVSEKANSGKAADLIANEVLQKIHQRPSTLSPTGLNVVTTELVDDRPNDYGLINNKVYMDRILTFRHNIYQT